MSLNLNSLMVGTMQLEAMKAFYERIFEKTPDWADERYCGWQVGNCWFSLGEHSEATGSAKEPGRILMNFETKDVQTEYLRMVAAGAKSVKEPYDIGGGQIATLEDPDGNYFQLMTPWEG